MSIEKIIAEVCGVDEGGISEDSGPKNIGEWDSMKHIHIITMCEAEYNVSFSASEVPLLTSVGKIKEVIGINS